MGFLDTYNTTLTSATAAHLLRRATFGPTKSEISNFVGKTATQAVNTLFSNASYRASPPPPVEMDLARSDAGEPFLTKPYNEGRNPVYNGYIQYWWIGLMAEQNNNPSVLEKLTAFWQNHFVVAQSFVVDYRFTYKYLTYLRSIATGNFREMAIGVTKDPAMLIFQNGNENEKEHPNENYGRELQELFTVGQKDFHGNNNYSEQDVKAAAQVLTGWQVTNRRVNGSTSFGTIFNPNRHDTSDKVFSSKYADRVITGRDGELAGDAELNDLIDMLLSHPETPKFICRKLYRWYVNANVTQEIEDQVIVPLASFFSSPSNNYEIAPVLKMLLCSNIFYDQRNIGAIIKSPSEFLIGSIRLFDLPVPDMTTEYGPFRTMMAFLSNNMRTLQLDFLDQPSVFGSLPYYQTGYSKNWINESSLGLRGACNQTLVYPTLRIKTGYVLGIEVLNRLQAIQPNFSDVTGTPAITCEQVLAEFCRNLFAVDLTQTQNDFLIDKIMMMNSSPRTTWTKEWDNYRKIPTDVSRQNTVLWRCRALLKYMLGMAEYQLF